MTYTWGLNRENYYGQKLFWAVKFNSLIKFSIISVQEKFRTKPITETPYRRINQCLITLRETLTTLCKFLFEMINNYIN